MDLPSTRKKLRETQFFLGHLQDESKKTVGDHEPFLFYLSAFLSAGRSVTWALQKEAETADDKTFPTWEQHLPPEDRALLGFFNEQRVAEVHQSGADVQRDIEKVSVYDALGEYARWEIVVSPSETLATIRKPVYYFLIESQQQEVTTACERYVGLLEAFLQDFASSD